jgi:short-subunit dehydrogenase involved in D-alanine esterification of teichoic acids
LAHSHTPQKAASKVTRGAMIVNLTSGLSYAPFPAAPIYSASKVAMH